MKYSVVITTFNSSLTVQNAITSVLNLSPPPDEVVIIDDASQDDTVDLISVAIQGLGTVRLILNSENRGQSYSRNLGVKESRNKIVIMMDDDDYSHTNRAKIHLDALEGGADISYVSSLKIYPNGYQVVARNSNVASTSISYRKLVQHLVVGSPLPNSGRVFSPSCALAVKKDPFLSINGFDVNLRRLEDIDFACRALRSGLVIDWSSEIALERFHTLGEDKSARANLDGELAVLESVHDLLGIRDYLVAREMALLRRYYFERDLFSILKKGFVLPILVLIAPRKVKAIIHRLKHDVLQRF